MTYDTFPPITPILSILEKTPFGTVKPDRLTPRPPAERAYVQQETSACFLYCRPSRLRLTALNVPQYTEIKKVTDYRGAELKTSLHVVGRSPSDKQLQKQLQMLLASATRVLPPPITPLLDNSRPSSLPCSSTVIDVYNGFSSRS